ncbi:MAG TPA: hypothetical protein ENG63_09760 [Candidatus Desulfofervidus auxilii]|uniref:Uncharacterized protein n=1 Tax=Desulfofervidus auxilii TaxID=1621989 RepID=A0A7C0Y413_DESA2|nr:hypothetical protein [Candidatus Desulfofervidus auxilii]
MYIAIKKGNKIINTCYTNNSSLLFECLFNNLIPKKDILNNLELDEYFNDNNIKNWTYLIIGYKIKKNIFIKSKLIIEED